MKQYKLNILSHGKGDWAYHILDPMISRTFQNTEIMHNTDMEPDLVIKSHFTNMESRQFNCPYILWSGEASHVLYEEGRAPLFELNTFFSDRQNSIYFPHLICEHKTMERVGEQVDKKYCCYYANSVYVKNRDELFNSLRIREPLCFSFGRCSHTNDNPFELGREDREQNWRSFSPFKFGIAMENSVVPGYVTEKFGFAIRARTVPIYWGDTHTLDQLFNHESYIDYSKFRSNEHITEYILNVYNDEHKYRTYTDKPPIVSNVIETFQSIYTHYHVWQKQMVDILRNTYPDIN
jgi:hypothetical protein